MWNLKKTKEKPKKNKQTKKTSSPIQKTEWLPEAGFEAWGGRNECMVFFFFFNLKKLNKKFKKHV